MLLRILELGPFLSNCYIVGSERTREGMVIDPGAEGKSILRNIEEMGLNIKLIIATHCHIDHISAVMEVKEATKAEFLIYKDEEPYLEKGKVHSLLFFGLPLKAPAPDRLLEEGEEIKIGELSFTIIHTPGHTPGSICLFGQGVVFTGDTLFNLGIGRSDLPGGDYSLLLKSLNKIAALPDETIVYPGHGPQTTIGYEKKWNTFLRKEILNA